ncbi:TonB-dependent receptor [Pelagicoccus sp. SDUM812003]|uniref:TonB-dependent receptor plug domain-containing protein n=1 Tax=Pelagicoccus sp. SDUM812003 TaxID=3041267 RepID=UPI00280D4C44|nr:TonB-dependent receptor [Pelagicoccus sp. SDUM812003]MDQ8201733.1 TonB-dependent receptor [Pelagicoccus sp. SDUM812003]
MSPCRNAARSSRLLKGALAASFLWALTATAAAQDLFDLSLEELLEVKITGATLTDKTLNTAPASTTLFTRQEISQLPVSTLEELLAFAPGYQSYRQGNLPMSLSYSSRGRKLGADSREILLLIDGQNVVNRSTASSPLPRFSIEGIDSIEIVRGPTSSIYGTNAFTGVINIKTIRDANRLTLSLGEHGQYAAHVQGAHALTADLNLSIQANYHIDENGQNYLVQDTFSPEMVETSDPFRLADIRLGLDSENSQITFFHSERKNTGFYARDRLSNAHNKSKRINTQLSALHSFEMGHDTRIVIQGNLRDFYNLRKLQATAPGAFRDISVPPSDAPNVGLGETEEREINLSVRSETAFANDDILTLGLDVSYLDIVKDEAYSNYNRFTFPFRYQPENLHSYKLFSAHDEALAGLFAQYQCLIDDDSELTLGFRYDDFSRSGSKFSPRIAYVRNFASQTFVKAIYGEAFRASNFTERFLRPDNVVSGNPDLKAESVQTFEIVAGAHTKTVYAAATLYQNSFRDSIRQVVQGDTILFTNSDSVTSKGLEAELIYHPTKNWRIRASLGRLLDKPDEFFREASTTGSLLLYRNIGDWSLSFGTVYNGERQALSSGPEARTTLPDYWLAHAKVQYQIGDHQTLRLRVNNLFDKDYRTPPLTVVPGQIPNRDQELTLSYSLTW